MFKNLDKFDIREDITRSLGTIKYYKNSMFMNDLSSFWKARDFVEIEKISKNNLKIKTKLIFSFKNIIFEYYKSEFCLVLKGYPLDVLEACTFIFPYLDMISKEKGIKFFLNNIYFLRFWTKQYISYNPKSGLFSSKKKFKFIGIARPLLQNSNLFDLFRDTFFNILSLVIYSSRSKNKDNIIMVKGNPLLLWQIQLKITGIELNFYSRHVNDTT